MTTHGHAGQAPRRVGGSNFALQRGVKIFTAGGGKASIKNKVKSKKSNKMNSIIK